MTKPLMKEVLLRATLHLSFSLALIGCSRGEPLLSERHPDGNSEMEVLDEVIEAIPHADLLEGGYSAAFIIAKHEGIWTENEVPLLIGLLDDETQLVWTSRTGIIWSVDKDRDTPTSPSELAANKLIEMHRGGSIEVVEPLIRNLIASELCTGQAAASTLNQLGSDAASAIQDLLEGGSQAEREQVGKWFRIVGEHIQYNLEFQGVEEVAEDGNGFSEIQDEGINPFDSSTENPIGIADEQ